MNHNPQPVEPDAIYKPQVVAPRSVDSRIPLRRRIWWRLTWWKKPSYTIRHLVMYDHRGRVVVWRDLGRGAITLRPNDTTTITITWNLWGRRDPSRTSLPLPSPPTSSPRCGELSAEDA